MNGLESLRSFVWWYFVCFSVDVGQPSVSCFGLVVSFCCFCLPLLRFDVCFLLAILVSTYLLSSLAIRSGDWEIERLTHIGLCLIWCFSRIPGWTQVNIFWLFLVWTVIEAWSIHCLQLQLHIVPVHSFSQDMIERIVRLDRRQAFFSSPILMTPVLSYGPSNGLVITFCVRRHWISFNRFTNTLNTIFETRCKASIKENKPCRRQKKKHIYKAAIWLSSSSSLENPSKASNKQEQTTNWGSLFTPRSICSTPIDLDSPHLAPSTIQQWLQTTCCFLFWER